MTYVKTYLSTLKTHVENLKRDVKDRSRDLQRLRFAARGRLGSKTLYCIKMHLLIVLHTFQDTSWENLFENHVIVGSGEIIFFSNSLIIHQEKTKKITTVTVVWICVPNYHKILPILALNFSKNY